MIWDQPLLNRNLVPFYNGCKRKEREPIMERNVYEKPEDRVLLRTADVYQTEARDDVESYSDKLLSIVADFRNGGMPEGANAQSMVGKSKKGEVACRLFARIDPDTGIIEAAGFKARGCLAMTACASAACLLIEGKGVEEALELSVEDIRAYVDDVPPGKVNALHFAPCAVKALVGDFLLREGADLATLDEAVACDECSVSCMLAEHCSLRQSRLELRMDELQAERERIRDNAVAEVFDLVRANTARGVLTTPADWEQLVPSQFTKKEFTASVLSLLDEEAASDDAPLSQAPRPKSAPAKPSAFANRGVGVPRIFGNKETTEEAAVPAAMPEEKRVFQYGIDVPDDEDFDLKPPEGYELVEVDGVWGLVKTDAPVAAEHRTPDAEGIRIIRAPQTVYLYDGAAMTSAFARWAYLSQEDDPIATFVYCVREESRTYPRPMAQESFANHPFNMDAEAVEAAFAAAAKNPDYADLHRITASNDDIYYYSSEYLEPDHAQSLAEWSSVGRYMNV